MKTDLLIIGSGPGGYRAAGYAARNGLSVVVTERDQAGGTCLNAGCMPCPRRICRPLRLCFSHGAQGIGYAAVTHRR